MVQKGSQLQVLEVFFKEPTRIHFIKEISRKINLAPTSVRIAIKELLKEDLIKGKEASPFNGFISNRENENFIFYKKVYNLYILKQLSDFLISNFYPKLIVLYGSYSLGEDIETSDIDIFISGKRKEIKLDKFEKLLERNIHLLFSDNINKLDDNIIKKIHNGIVLYGGY